MSVRTSKRQIRTTLNNTDEHVFNNDLKHMDKEYEDAAQTCLLCIKISLQLVYMVAIYY